MTSRNDLRALAMALIQQGWDPLEAAIEATKQLSDQDAAYQEMMRSETRDPTGLYSEGGTTMGGIFGAEPVQLTDHDSSARRRGVETRAQMSGVEQTMLMRQMMQMQAAQAETNRALMEATAKLKLLEAGRSREGEDDSWDHPERGRRKRTR